MPSGRNSYFTVEDGFRLLLEQLYGLTTHITVAVVLQWVDKLSYQAPEEDNEHNNRVDKHPSYRPEPQGVAGGSLAANLVEKSEQRHQIQRKN